MASVLSNGDTYFDSRCTIIMAENGIKTEQLEDKPSVNKDFEELLKRVGDQGRYQWQIFVLASLCGLFTSLHAVGAAFLAATPDFVCDVFHPHDDQSDKQKFQLQKLWNGSKCEFNVSAMGTFYREASQDGENEDLQKCTSWIYDDSVYQSTIVTEWDLVCDKRWIMSSVQASYMAGVLIGAIVLSELSDLYGRRTIALISTVGFSMTAIPAGVSPGLEIFLILRFCIAFFSSGLYLSNFVNVMEVAGKEIRTTLGIMYHIFFTLGMCILPGIAYLFNDWRQLQMAISLPSTILLLYFKVLPESPRWLLSQNRHSEALEVLRKIAKVNGITLATETELQTIFSKKYKINEESANLFVNILTFFKNQAILLKTPILRRRSLIMYFSWFAVSMSYYGLVFSSNNINASMYITMLLGGIVEIPAYIVSVFTINKFGRRLNVVVSFILCGVTLILILIVPKDYVWVNISLVIFGKYLSSAIFNIVYIYSTELMPTTLRNFGLGTSSMCARVGSIFAPYIVDCLGQIHYAIPSTVFGVLLTLAGLLDLLLPETGNVPLPETVEEIEMLEK